MCNKWSHSFTCHRHTIILAFTSQPQGVTALWLVTYRDKCPAPELNPDMVTHRSTNRARRRLTSLIETNALYATMPNHVCLCKNWTRNSSGDEIANVNFLYDDIVHVLQNAIDSCINSATARRGGYVLEGMFTKFSEITQCNGHYAVQGHSRSPIFVPIESSYTTSH